MDLESILASIDQLTRRRCSRVCSRDSGIHARLHPRDRWPMDGRQSATVDFGAGLDPFACSNSDPAAPAEETGLGVARHETPPRKKNLGIS